MSAAELLLREFERLSEAPGAVPRLRRFIRDLAVRGRLTDQRAADAVAQVRSEREALSDGSFNIPSSWRWARVEEIADYRLGKMLDRAKNRGTPRPYLRNVNVRWFDFDLSDLAEMPFEETEFEEFVLRRNDVLVCEGGEPGRAAVWDGRVEDVYFQKAIHRLRLATDVDPYFVVNVLRHAADEGVLLRHFTGVTIKHLTGRGLASFPIPVPPLAEQHRINAKLDELMALCRRLEAAQTAVDTHRRRVLEAVLDAASDSRFSNRAAGYPTVISGPENSGGR